MKTAKLITAAVLATLALAACNKDDESPTGDQVDIRTTICANADIASADIGTRATIAPDGSGTFATGDELGLYAYVGTTAKLDNSSYKVGTTTLYWDELSKTAPVAFSAYYPKVADIANAAAYAFNAATATTPDLLVATPVTKSKGEQVTLDFRHAMHRLEVNITTNISGWDAATAKITLMGMNATASVNILTGVTTSGEASEADGDYAPQTGAATTFIVAPQKVTTGADWIQIELGGKTFTYQVPAQYNKPDGGGAETLSQLNSGETLTLTLNVKRDGVTLTSGNISAWNTQGTIDDTIDYI
ncbi:fimbrillin family protein [Bacteroides hominis]|uniref:fimbrillin family protein n=1 Tax=Bacteroides hominis TaxID=2763023 RepID=UPI003D6B58B1